MTTEVPGSNDNSNLNVFKFIPKDSSYPLPLREAGDLELGKLLRASGD